jgi:hypothetical protein
VATGDEFGVQVCGVGRCGKQRVGVAVACTEPVVTQSPNHGCGDGVALDVWQGQVHVGCHPGRRLIGRGGVGLPSG